MDTVRWVEDDGANMEENGRWNSEKEVEKKKQKRLQEAGVATTRRDFWTATRAVLPSEEAGYLQSDDFRIAKRPAAERRHRPL